MGARSQIIIAMFCLVFSRPRSESWPHASLHLSLPSTLLIKCTIGRFVHVAMLFIHVIRCPPLHRVTGLVWSSSPGCLRVSIWYDHSTIISSIVLWQAILYNTPAFSHLFSFAAMKLVSSAFSGSSSYVFVVQLSHSYAATGQTRAFPNCLIFVAMEVPWLFRIFCNDALIACLLASRALDIFLTFSILRD